MPVLALFACSGGDDGGAAAPSDAPAAVATDPTPAAEVPSESSSGRTPEQLAADQATAESIVLQLGDFPSGWEAKPRGPSSSDTPEAEAAEDELAACLEVDPALVSDDDAEEQTKARSEKFSSGDLDADMSATLIDSADRAQAEFAALQQPNAPACLQAFFAAAIKYAIEHPDPGREVPEGVTFGDAEVTPLDVSNVRGQPLAFQMKMPVSARGITVNLFMDFVLVLKGRTGLTFTFGNVGQPFPTDREVQLANIAVDRAPET